MDDDITAADGSANDAFGFVTSPDELARIFQEPRDGAEDVVTYRIFHRACLESTDSHGHRETLEALQKRIACFVKEVVHNRRSW